MNRNLIEQITPNGYDKMKAVVTEGQLQKYEQLRNETVKEMFVFAFPEYAKEMYPEVFV